MFFEKPTVAIKFTATVIKILLIASSLGLRPAQQVSGRERVKIFSQKQKQCSIFIAAN